ncbi:MAG: haloacid dehalogenase-like hydrolase [Planctomycetota bacterium]
MYKHVIWDWNGTLFDDAWLCVEVLNGLLARRGMPSTSPARYAEEFDFPVRDYYVRIGFDFAREPYEAVAAEFMAEYERRREECRLQPDALAALRAVAAAGIGQSLLSIYPHITLEAVTRRHKVRNFFEKLSGLNNLLAGGKIENGKCLVAELGIPPGHILLAGDSTHDHDVAQAIGARGILTPRGHYTRERLAATGAPVVDRLSDILPLITT